MPLPSMTTTSGEMLPPTLSQHCALVKIVVPACYMGVAAVPSNLRLAPGSACECRASCPNRSSRYTIDVSDELNDHRV